MRRTEQSGKREGTMDIGCAESMSMDVGQKKEGELSTMNILYTKQQLRLIQIE